MRNVKFIYSTLLVMMGLSLGAEAQDMIPQVKAQPILIFTPGESIVFKIDENREATLAFSHTQPYFIKVKVDLAETLCVEEYVTPRCSYSIDYASDHMALLWTKHPDASKLGHVVKYSYVSSAPTELDTLVGETFANRFMGSVPDDRFRPDEFACDNYEWLGPQNSQLHVQLWSSERMTQNIETGVNENRTEQMVENVIFNRKENNVFELIQAGHVSALIPSALLMTSGNASTLQIFNSAKTEACQASLSYNISAAIAGMDLDAHYKENPNFSFVKGNYSNSFKRFKDRFRFVLDPPKGATPADFQ